VNHIIQVKRCLEKIQAQSRLPGGQKA